MPPYLWIGALSSRVRLGALAGRNAVRVKPSAGWPLEFRHRTLYDRTAHARQRRCHDPAGALGDCAGVMGLGKVKRLFEQA